MATKNRVQLLALDEVADRLRLSLHTVRRWASVRRLPIVKLGRRVLVSENERLKLVDARTVPAHAGTLSLVHVRHDSTA